MINLLKAQIIFHTFLTNHYFDNIRVLYLKEKWFYEIGYFSSSCSNWNSFKTMEIDLFLKFYKDLGYIIIIE